MKKITLKTSILPFALLSLFAISNLVFASEVTGNLTTQVTTDTINGVVMVVPTASPAAGTYTSAQNFSLSASGASSIHYTTDGTVPTCSIGNTYSSLISISTSQTIQAISCYSGNHSSPVASFAYIINSQTNEGGGGGGNGGGSGPLTRTFRIGDANRDGNVDILDFVILMANWDATGLGTIADFNNDGNVNVLDFVLLMANWTQ